MKRALVIAHEPDCHGGQIAMRLQSRGFTVDTHVVTPDPDRPDSPTPFPAWGGYDLIVLMGSRRSLTRKDEIASWIHPELDLIRTAHAAGTPILGVCFGGQLLADALGGSVEEAAVTELGWFAIDGEDNPVGAGPWMEWHHDRFTPPPGAEVLASTEHAVQLFRIGRSLGTQFHPEVDVVHIEAFLADTDDSYLVEYGTDRDRLLAATAVNEEANIKQCHALVDWFLDEVSGLSCTGGDSLG